MHRFGILLLLGCACALARHDVSICGTTRETPGEALFLHRQAVRARRARTAMLAAPAAAPADRDIGNIAILEDSGGVVEISNQFNLANSTLTFTPGDAEATRYRYEISGASYDAAAASQGTPVIALGDDDAREVQLPFAFRFFGATYRSVWINSDGNLTFGAAENASSSRLTGRVTGGPPRIAPLFDDLDPSKTAGGVRTFADGGRFVVSWVAVPEYTDFGTGQPQTFQVRLYTDGRIAFAWGASTPASAVVGIAPGYAKGATTLVSFRNDAPAEYTAAVVERFGDSQEIDIVLAAQRFYQTHDDAYDYLVFYNNVGIDAMAGALAYESTVRSIGTGYGVEPADNGTQYGSGSRLRGVLNMGTLAQYPTDPNGYVKARGPSNDSPLSILGHEAGHLFLANASVPDPDDPSLRPMLGYGGVHWSFVFNSEASLDEGEQITDRGAGASPRFLTGAVTQHYSPLDQYLMGFRAAAAVPDTFVVRGYDPNVVNPTWHPVGGIGFDGTPLRVTVDDIVKAEGRRTPDATVAQRRYRFAFVLVVPAGSQPDPSTLAKLEAYRQQFSDYYGRAADGNASADTTLAKSVKLNLFPAAGVLAGGSASAAVSLAGPAAADLTVRLDAPGGFAQAPATVRIAAGATSATFAVNGVRAGVEELTATPLDPAYETAFARVQVADASQARMAVLGGTPDAVTVRLTDANGLPYPGAAVTATASEGGTVTPVRTVTDAQGRAAFRWTYGEAASTELRVAAEALPSVGVTLRAGSAVAAIGAVVNAASYLPGISPGGIATIFGANLDAAAKVTVNGADATVFYASATQINFLVPQATPLGAATVTAVLPSGAAPEFEVNSAAEDAGIFAIVPHPGYIEIYATGLGATRAAGGFMVTALTPSVYFGSTPAAPLYSGLAPGFAGLYQVNVAVPAGVSGTVPVLLSVGKSVSNSVQVTIQ